MNTTPERDDLLLTDRYAETGPGMASNVYAALVVAAVTAGLLAAWAGLHAFGELVVWLAGFDPNVVVTALVGFMALVLVAYAAGVVAQACWTRRS